MADDVGPLRSAEKLNRALAHIARLRNAIGAQPPRLAGLDARRLDYEVLLAENGSTDGTPALLNLAAVACILAAQLPMLLHIRARGSLGMLALLLASWAAGWLLGGREAGQRKAMTLTASLRNVGVGLVIATGSFGGTPAVTAVIAYGLFAVVGSLLLALVWGRWTAAK